MPLNWKRIALLIGFLVAVIAIGYALYFVFLRPALPKPPAEVNVNVEPGVLPETGVNVNIPTAGLINGALPGQINVNLGPSELPVAPVVSEIAKGDITKTTALTPSAALSPVLDSDGKKAIYYDKNTGLFYRVTSEGTAYPVSDQVFYGVENVTWDPRREKAIIEYPDGSNIIYDFTNDQQITLPKHWEDFSYAPSGNQFIFKSIGLNSENNWLAISNSDGSRAIKLQLLGDMDETLYPDWSPNNQIVAMYRKYDSLQKQNLYFIGLNNENYKSTALEGQGFEGQWSSKGDRLLYSVYSATSDYNPTLWIVEASGDNIGQNRKNLKLNTWADKCTFSNNDMIYCAVPKSLPTAAGMFRADMDTQPCDIYRIDLATGFKSKIATPDNDQNIENLIVTEDERYLYYQSKDDGKLYKINLR